jgi:hypothetical protein
MINRIKSERALLPYLKARCEDAGVSVEIDPRLGEKDYAVIKTDEYYQGLRLPDTPKSVDCVAVVDCVTNWYALHIIEFKGTKDRAYIKSKDIQGKFDTAVNGFLSDAFGAIFKDARYKYKAVRAYLVCNAILIGNSPRDTLRRDKDFTLKPYRFGSITFTVSIANPSDITIKRLT